MPSVSASPTRLKFWGTRGSISVPGRGTLGYGGNTTCVEMRADGEIIVLDAGSGIRSLGIALEKEFHSQPIKLSLVITHAHWDHIQGLPFFAPAYEKKNESPRQICKSSRCLRWLSSFYHRRLDRFPAGPRALSISALSKGQ